MVEGTEGAVNVVVVVVVLFVVVVVVLVALDFLVVPVDVAAVFVGKVPPLGLLREGDVLVVPTVGRNCDKLTKEGCCCCSGCGANGIEKVAVAAAVVCGGAAAACAPNTNTGGGEFTCCCCCCCCINGAAVAAAAEGKPSFELNGNEVVVVVELTPPRGLCLGLFPCINVVLVVVVVVDVR